MHYFVLLMAIIPHTISLDTTAVHYPAGVGPSEADSCQIRVTRYQRKTNEFTREQGIIYKRKHIPCVVSWENGAIVLSLGRNNASDTPRLRIACDALSTDRTFNTRQQGSKSGVWFRFYPWGTLRKATLFHQGTAERIAIFRPNGNLARYYTRRPSGKTLQVSKYDKEGKPLSNIF